jgi:hypothetical protein
MTALNLYLLVFVASFFGWILGAYVSRKLHRDRDPAVNESTPSMVRPKFTEETINTQISTFRNLLHDYTMKLSERETSSDPDSIQPEIMDVLLQLFSFMQSLQLWAENPSRDWEEVYSDSTRVLALSLMERMDEEIPDPDPED